MDRHGKGRPCRGRGSGTVEAVRNRLADGITADEYERTVAVLAQMASNLDAGDGVVTTVRADPGQPRPPGRAPG